MSTPPPGRGHLNLVSVHSYWTANVTGIVIATAIVTVVMASMDYPPTLAGVSDSADAGLLAAFTSGMRLAFRIAAGIVLLGAVLSVFKGRMPHEQ